MILDISQVVAQATQQLIDFSHPYWCHFVLQSTIKVLAANAIIIWREML